MRGFRKIFQGWGSKEGSYCIHIDTYICILVFLYNMEVILRIISLQNYQIKKLALSNNAPERMYRDYMHLYCNLYLWET